MFRSDVRFSPFNGFRFQFRFILHVVSSEHREMTSYLQRQHLVVLQTSQNLDPRSIGLGIALLAILLSTSTHAAVFTVNSSFDVSDANPGNGICETATGNGACTLRAAIQETNALPGGDEINLAPGTYLLTIVNELLITDTLTITGGGASSTIIDGNKSARPNSRVLLVGSGITVNITGVTIRNGGTNGSGGGIFNVGTLALSNIIVSDNQDDEDGGGIFSSGILTLTNSTVTGNTAADDAGGIFNITGGTMTLTNITVSRNSAGDGGGGIRNSGTLTLTNSTVSANSAGQNGGGIYNFL